MPLDDISGESFPRSAEERIEQQLVVDFQDLEVRIRGIIDEFPVGVTQKRAIELHPDACLVDENDPRAHTLKPGQELVDRRAIKLGVDVNVAFLSDNDYRKLRKTLKQIRGLKTTEPNQ